MESLKVHQVQAIIYRLRSDQSERSIVRDIGCARETVRRYARVARASGFLAASSGLLSLAQVESACAEVAVGRHSNVSTVEAYRPIIEALLKNEVEGVAIHRKLCKAHGFTGAYGSVRRFIAMLKAVPVEAIVRVETPRGVEAQVDFGMVGKMWDALAKWERTCYCFVMTACCSRHTYLRLVFDQQISTWLEFHRIIDDVGRSAECRTALTTCQSQWAGEHSPAQYSILSTLLIQATPILDNYISEDLTHKPSKRRRVQ